MQKSAHAMLLAYDTNSVQEYSRRTDKWKKSSWGADMLFTTTNDNVFFFQLHSLTWIPHYPVLWKRVESFHSNPVWYSQFYEDEDFQKENSQKKKRKEVVVYPVPARTLACRHFLIYTVGSYLHGKDISETKGIDKNKCKEAWSSFFSYTVCFLF